MKTTMDRTLVTNGRKQIPRGRIKFQSKRKKQREKSMKPKLANHGVKHILIYRKINSEFIPIKRSNSVRNSTNLNTTLQLSNIYSYLQSR